MTLAPAVIAASVALIVAVLTPAAASLRARRQAINEKFDAAISALLMVQATRHVATGIQRRYHPGDDKEYRRFTVRMAEESISEFIAQTAAARAALASISRYVPEVREWVTTAWELTEEREPEQRRLIELRRASALRTERLLRQSLPPAVSTR
jgi:hypothetical protein